MQIFSQLVRPLCKPNLGLHPGSVCAVIVIVLLSAWNFSFGQEDLLNPEVSWTNPSRDEVVAAIQQWMDESSVELVDRTKVMESFQLTDLKMAEPIDLVMKSIAVLRPGIESFTNEILIDARKFKIDRVNDLEPGAFIHDHLRLFLARHLVQNQMYDEAMMLFEQISLSRVLDPATLLFYKAVCQHQLIQKEDCLESANRLLENETRIPRRFAMLAKLMVADIGKLKEDSLDEVARLMNDIQRRQYLHRAGKRVRGQEEKVLEKLDGMIKQLQEQQQMMQQAKSSQQKAPSKPMQDSQNSGGLGKGEAFEKAGLDGGAWGNLPAKDRAAALAEISKDLPPHYRTVIEEYFRRLALEKDGAQK